MCVCVRVFMAGCIYLLLYRTSNRISQGKKKNKKKKKLSKKKKSSQIDFNKDCLKIDGYY